MSAFGVWPCASETFVLLSGTSPSISDFKAAMISFKNFSFRSAGQPVRRVTSDNKTHIYVSTSSRLQTIGGTAYRETPWWQFDCSLAGHCALRSPEWVDHLRGSRTSRIRSDIGPWRSSLCHRWECIWLWWVPFSSDWELSTFHFRNLGAVLKLKRIRLMRNNPFSWKKHGTAAYSSCCVRDCAWEHLA